ncbi:hypothetical protein BGZ96_010451 [Linnemannia gamsii]|uniref:NIPSNAP domain-containing protein n=1 Tax=Linnemannia gamsii TaxID=64522 RepID=A0ABQ7JU55_9FUNG|nr:hypothetical protein BGZ96_010451 [Linnemannia gamsii]
MSALLRNQASFARAALVSSRAATIQAPRAATALPMVTRALSSAKNPPADATTASEGSDNNAKDSNKPLGKVSGIVNSILHGSGTLPKIQSQESWGVSLARGKYVHELQIHIWEFEGYLGHAQEMDRLRRDPTYQKFLKDLRSMLISRDNQICLEFAFWKSRPPVALGGIYEMRTYLLKPGNLLEWETNWRRGLECRRQFCEPVGAWFSQLGKLNYVHHMWNYPDLETRKKTREQAWKVDGWAETVYNTVRLIENMEANILLPMDFSSLK